ncbi:MAG: EamA family transporter [Candidatus Muiribacteriota bacterium]
MFDLILSIAFSVLIAVVLRFNTGKNIAQIFWGNYFVAFTFSLFLYKGEIPLQITPELLCGILTGSLFLINFFLYNKNIGINGLSLAVGVMRISLVLPVILSIIFFAESVELFKILAIVIILTAFYNLSGTKKPENFIFLILLFITTGTTDFTLKIYEYFYSSDMNLFLFFAFLSAFIINTGIVIKQKKKIEYKNLFIGVLVGFPNQLTALYFLKGLNTVPASIAYPFFGSGVVVLSLILDKLIWKTKLSFKQKISFGLMIAGIILLNI